MFESPRMILKGSKQIGLGQMPRVSCLGEEAEVRKLQFTDDEAPLLLSFSLIRRNIERVDEQEKSKYRSAEPYREKIDR